MALHALLRQNFDTSKSQGNSDVHMIEFIVPHNTDIYCTAAMDLRSSYIIVIFVAVSFVDCDIHYILPSTNGTVCPSTYNCIILSHIGGNSSVISGLNTTFLFQPGNHTLTSSLTIQSLSSFQMIANEGLPRPVINCEQFAHFHLLYTSYVKIDGLSLNGCFDNRISMIDKFVIKDSTMLGNTNVSGRAMVVTKSTILAIGTLFESFIGAISLSLSSVWIIKCTFVNNSALKNGGALHIEDRCNITVEYSSFSFHTCDVYNLKCLGAVMYSQHSEVLIMNCTFDNNKYGAIVVSHSEVRIVNSYFSENFAQYGGAAIQVRGGMTTISDTYFFHNKVDNDYYEPTETVNSLYTSIPGGTVRCHSCKIKIIRSLFERNEGVALLGLVQGQITISSCQFSYNSAAELGGGFYATLRTKIYISGITTFENNVAYYGAAFHAFLSAVSITGRLSVVNNTANRGAIGIVHSTATIKANIVFSENIGSFYVYSGEVSIIPCYNGEAIFTRNYQITKTGLGNENETVASGFFKEGGAITLFVSRLELQIKTILRHNIASNGGGILAVTSTIVCNNTLTVSANAVTDTGGGLYLYQSELSVFGIVTISNNTANICGGGVHAISAFLKLIRIHPDLRGVGIRGSISFQSNVAEKCGGGAFFETGSKINILRYGPDTVKFIQNTADYGGAVYVADDTNVGMCSSGQKYTLTATTQSECFFQLLSVTKPKNTSATITDAFKFKQNRANYSGTDLFGGLLDRCTVNSYTKMVEYSSIQGFAKSIEKTSSSKPVRICLCNSAKQVKCGSRPITFRVKKDKTFNVYVAAVDQMNHTVNATIHSYLSSTLGNLGEGQQVQSIGSSCDNITFSIVSPKQNEVLVIYAEGPCKDLGISPLRFPIEFIPCHCPLGFEQYKIIKNKCVCVCHQKLKEVFKFISESDCNSTTLLISRNRDFWMAYTTNETLITAKQCPSDYCLPASNPVHIDLSTLDGPDTQCKFNRSGLLCGACKTGLTLSIGSSRCIKCPNYWPALSITILVSAILAGLAVVILMLALNLTVAKGTLNGMIFYSNILAANQDLFVQFDHPNFLSVFIAWLNLDLGFDACFIRDLDTYFKVWLQLSFPTYLILLVVAVILISRHSIRFARLISKRNPVATLATLILLSYAKLLQSIIKVFSYTTLRYTPMNESESFEVVWLSDASISYLSGKHIPLFILEIFILVIGVAYTFGLTSWQWLVRLSHTVAFKWVKSAKLTSFMDAYHAPYMVQNRYWTGLLLLARVVLYLTSATNVSGEPRFNLLAVSLIIGSIFLLHAYSGLRIYKQWVLEVLEFTTYFNILALAVATFYVLQINGDGTTVTLVSIGTQFVLFVSAMTYHIVVESNALERMKNSKWYKDGFHLELTTHLLHETEPPAVNQMVTFSEVTINDSKDQLLPYE